MGGAQAFRVGAFSREAANERRRALQVLNGNAVVHADSALAVHALDGLERGAGDAGRAIGKVGPTAPVRAARVLIRWAQAGDFGTLSDIRDAHPVRTQDRIVRGASDGLRTAVEARVGASRNAFHAGAVGTRCLCQVATFGGWTVLHIRHTGPIGAEDGDQGVAGNFGRTEDDVLNTRAIRAANLIEAALGKLWTVFEGRRALPAGT